MVTKITDDLIRKVLLPQLHGKEDIKSDGHSYHYAYYFAILKKTKHTS